MVKWEDEIRDILAKQNREPQPEWDELFKQMMPLMEVLTVMALGGTVIHSPERGGVSLKRRSWKRAGRRRRLTGSSTR